MRRTGKVAPPKLETESPLLTADELAVWFHCTRRAIYDRVFRGQLPGVVRLGRRLYFDRVMVEAWLKKNAEANTPGYFNPT